jgi:lysophospholipase L1-like esterase
VTRHRFLALGDSYTIGEAVDEAGRWPVQLAARLRARGVQIAAPEIIARTGWSTDELAAAIDAAEPPPRGPYDLVSLLIGVNNQYRRRGVEEYAREFDALLARAVVFAGGDAGRVLVLSIPDWSATPFADGDDRDRRTIALAIDAFNAVNHGAARRAGARYVDVTGVSRRAETDPALTAQDGLHPSALQYAEWADLALPAALRALGGL